MWTERVVTYLKLFFLQGLNITTQSLNQGSPLMVRHLILGSLEYEIQTFHTKQNLTVATVIYSTPFGLSSKIHCGILHFFFHNCHLSSHAGCTLDCAILSRVHSSVTNNKGFCIGLSDLLTPSLYSFS
jgi:hypothetical protein